MKYIDPYILIDELVSELSKRITYLYKNDQRNTSESQYLRILRNRLEQIFEEEK